MGGVKYSLLLRGDASSNEVSDVHFDGRLLKEHSVSMYFSLK